MLARVSAVATNTYREAVRARVLFGLLALALATTLYSLVIAAMSLRQEMRIVADIGSASISLYAVLVAIILGATSLHREVELKTIFPILTRRLRRHEYILGKYFGTVATLATFIAIDGATVLAILAFQTKEHVTLTAAVCGGMLIALGIVLWVAKRSRAFVLLPWSFLLFLAMALLADGTGGERQVLILSSLLALAEVAIVSAIAMLFSSFSSPFLTAIFTMMLFVIGRSADSLGHLPQKTFGSLSPVAKVISRVVPNLNVYVPARPLLLGQVAEEIPGIYVARASSNALFYACILLALSAVIFRKRDFQ